MVIDLLKTEKASVLIPLMEGPKNRWELLCFYQELDVEDEKKKYIQRSKGGRFKTSVLDPLENDGLIFKRRGEKRRQEKRGRRSKKRKEDRRVFSSEANVKLILNEWFAYFLSHDKRLRPPEGFVETIGPLRKEIFNTKRMETLLNLNKILDRKTGEWTQGPDKKIWPSLFGYIGMCLVFAYLGNRRKLPGHDGLSIMEKNILAIVKQGLWKCVRKVYPEYSAYDYDAFFEKQSEETIKSYEEILSYSSPEKDSGLRPIIGTILYYFSRFAVETKNGKSTEIYAILEPGVKIRKNLKETYEIVKKAYEDWELKKSQYKIEKEHEGRPYKYIDGDAIKNRYGIFPNEKEIELFVDAAEFLDLYPAFDKMIQKFI
jgi:hypothetical protein